jgi:hypothetical protein
VRGAGGQCQFPELWKIYRRNLTGTGQLFVNFLDFGTFMCRICESVKETNGDSPARRRENMAWMVTDLGHWIGLGAGETPVEATDWRPCDTATMTGGMVILGFHHGVRPPHTQSLPATPCPLVT